MLAVLSACNLINPEEPIPALIELNPVELHVLPGQGSARHKITEVWTYANNNYIGAFSPPVTIPFLTDVDQSQFIFRAGIRNNGILDDALVYPMYTSYETTLTTTPGSVSMVNPVFSYRPEVVFSLIADFEITNEFVDNRDTVAASQLVRSDVEPFEGSFSGEIILTPQAHLIEIGHGLPLNDLPIVATRATYLEFQYKSEAAMSIGLLGIPLNGNPVSNFFYLLKPSPTWNMIYIELTDRLVESGFTSYKILFRSIYPSEATQPSYIIQLDNIKVVHL